MEKNARIVISTRLDTSSTELSLKQLVNAVNKTMNRMGAFASSMLSSFAGQIAEAFSLKNVIKYLKETIALAMELFSMSKVVEQFKGIAGAFGQKLLDLKVSAEMAIIPICSMLMSVGSGLVDFFTDVTNAIAEVTAKTVGVQKKSSISAQTAAKGQTALAQATKAAGTAARGTLAAFDELNVLERKSGGSAGGGSGGKPEKPDKPNEPEYDEGRLSFLEQLLKVLEPLTEELFAGLRWGYENVLLPLSQWTGNELVPSFLGALGSAAQTLATVLDVLKPAATWLWENFLQPLGQWSGEMVIVALDGIAGAFEALSLWIDENREKLTALWEGIEPMLTIMSEVIIGIFDGIKEYFGLWIETFTQMLTGSLDLWMGLITGNWEQAWKGIQTIFGANKDLLLGSFGILWELIKSGFSKALEAVKLIWAPIGEWFMQNVMAPLDKNFGWLWDGIVQAAKIAWQMVLGVWEPLSGWFMEKVVTPVFRVVKGLWESICNAFDTGLAAIGKSLTDYINLCAEMFEAGANAIIGLFNKVIDALNTISVDIPDWVPEYGGRSFGVNIPRLPSVTIPRLATGAVIPPNAQFAAILGDQRAGRNLEAPEGLIREIVREESGAREIIVRFEGSMAQLARVLAPAIEQENARQGTRLILGGT